MPALICLNCGKDYTYRHPACSFCGATKDRNLRILIVTTVSALAGAFAGAAIGREAAPGWSFCLTPIGAAALGYLGWSRFSGSKPEH